jgi:hypothetical protein
MDRIAMRETALAAHSRPAAMVCAVIAMGFFSGASAQSTPQPVLQRGYDSGQSGANLSETILDVSNVTPTTFGAIFSVPVDDAIFAQPLYVPNVAIPNQGAHNVVYVATMSDTLYALDAENGNELWTVNLASLVDATPVAIASWALGGNKNIVGNLGILSTPVIDLSTNLMYVVSCTLESDAMTYRLWAINITNGSQPLGNGVLISASYRGVTFNARYQTQRVSLALSGDHVVFGFGALEAEAADQYSGWMMAYNKSTLAQSGVFATLTKGGLGGGVWQTGRAPAIDRTGVYMYVGNAYGSGYDGVNNFSESALRLEPANGMKLGDWFTPDNWSTLDGDDLDLSSSGPLLIAGTTQPLLAGGGKQGVFYLLDRSNLGKFSSTDAGVVQEFQMGEFRGGPVLWHRAAAQGGILLFNWSPNSYLQSFAFNGTQFATTPTTQSSATQIWPGGILTLSANGSRSNTGIIWANVATSGNANNDPPVPGALYAFNAENLSQQLWSSTTDASRDGFGNFGKFVPPLVANGRVYMATWSNQLVVYGLLSAYTVMPNTLAFGSQPIDTKSAPQTVTVTNTGTVPLLIKGINFSSTGPDYFSEKNNCGSSVAVGSGCVITIYFAPTATGTAQATLNVRTASGAATQSIALSGTGT